MILSPEIEQDFLRFAIDTGVLRFGRFQTKAGRQSPYFFNAGLFNSGESVGRLGKFYARALMEAESQGILQVDMLFGPAYKGIPLVTTTAVAAARKERDFPFAFNRKEAKDHGEGGSLVGAPLQGRVLILDDVISAGTSVSESVAIIRAAGAEPAGVLIALDRMERTGEAGSLRSAVDQVQTSLGIPVISLAGLTGLISLLEASHDEALTQFRDDVLAYRSMWGVAG